jgi:ABC-type transporter Mla subunit MlaD
MKIKAKKKPKPEIRFTPTPVDPRQLVALLSAASQMADDLRDFGSENAEYYATFLDDWSPDVK